MNKRHDPPGQSESGCSAQPRIFIDQKKADAHHLRRHLSR